jgi:Tat protein translocase TatC
MALIDRFTGDLDDRRMSLGEHLEELRKHVTKSMIWIALALTVCLCFQTQLMRWATWPFTSCMEELNQEVLTRRAKARSGQPAFVNAAFSELRAKERLEGTERRLEQNALILREQVAKNPEAFVEAFAKRRTDLEKRQQDLEAAQDALAKDPDPTKVADLERQRLALASDTRAYVEDMKRDIAPLSEKGAASTEQLRPVALTFPETFMSYLKVAMVCAIFVASPLVARELWKFVSAGLFKHEKKYVTFFAPLTFIVFIIGCSFGYFVLIPAGLKFLASYGGDEIGTEFRLSEYLSLLLNLTLMVGLIFELPLVMAFVSLIGFTDAALFRKFRRYWLLVAFILGAVIAPSPDPFNQSLCAVPLIILYEIGILLSAWIVKKREGEKMNPLPEGVQMAPMPASALPPPPQPAPGATTRP